MGYPFTDRTATKRRPAVVLSAGAFNRQAGHSVMAMITSASDNPWPEDVAIRDLAAAGLSMACSVRFKVFTLDSGLVPREAGRLSKVDAAATDAAVRSVLATTR